MIQVPTGFWAGFVAEHPLWMVLTLWVLIIVPGFLIYQVTCVDPWRFGIWLVWTTMSMAVGFTLRR
jgi:hypothetical protein